MPICKACGLSFPRQTNLDGKVIIASSKRKYCFICSPFGAHNTRDLNKKAKACICSNCGRKYIYTSANRQGHTCTRCNSCMANKRRCDRKIRAVEYKGGKCIVCGYNRCKRSLVFHHKDGKKDFSISSAHCRSWENIKKELDRCTLLCANCHGEVHDGLVVIKE